MHSDCACVEAQNNQPRANLHPQQLPSANQKHDKELLDYSFRFYIFWNPYCEFWYCNRDKNNGFCFLNIDGDYYTKERAFHHYNWFCAEYQFYAFSWLYELIHLYYKHQSNHIILSIQFRLSRFGRVAPNISSTSTQVFFFLNYN